MDELSSNNYLLIIFMSIGLVTATGFRVFLPLFITTLFAKYGIIKLNLLESLGWLEFDRTIIILGILSALEIAIYYMPILGNLFGKLSILLSTIVGVFLFKILMPESMSAFLSWFLAILFGGGISFLVSIMMSTARNVSKVTTRGEGNFVINSVETLCSLILIFVSIYLPIISLFFVVFVLYSCYYAYNRVVKKIKGNELHYS